MNPWRNSWRPGLLSSGPLMVGYLPVAITFGVVANGAHLSGWLTLLISGSIFAGASQFALVGLISGGASLWAAIPAVALLNARHLVYGSILGRMLPTGAPKSTYLAAFGLTDEVFAAATAKLNQLPEGERHPWLLGLATGAYCAWMLGTAFGVLFGDLLVRTWPKLDQTLRFALPALLLALGLQMLGGRKSWAAASAVLAASALTLVGRSDLAVFAAATAGVGVGALGHLRGGQP